jgi:hypothetical protein
VRNELCGAIDFFGSGGYNTTYGKEGACMLDKAFGIMRVLWAIQNCKTFVADEHNVCFKGMVPALHWSIEECCTDLGGSKRDDFCHALVKPVLHDIEKTVFPHWQKHLTMDRKATPQDEAEFFPVFQKALDVSRKMYRLGGAKKDLTVVSSHLMGVCDAAHNHCRSLASLISYIKGYYCGVFKCDAVQELEASCMDAETSCPSWAKQGQCHANPKFMHTTCKRSCNLCGICKDNKASCATWAKTGSCKTNAAFMDLYCRKSCSRCDAITSPAVTPTSASVKPKLKCVDENEACEVWTKNGECTTNPKYMHKFCARSCKACCVDKTKKCAAWGKQGQCDSNPNRMYSHCPKTCGVCKDAADLYTCNDASPDCIEWAKHGECDSNRAYMADQCKSACNLCPATPAPTPAPTHLPTSAPTVAVCTSKHKDCNLQAAKGWCFSMLDTMRDCSCVCAGLKNLTFGSSDTTFGTITKLQFDSAKCKGAATGTPKIIGKCVATESTSYKYAGCCQSGTVLFTTWNNPTCAGTKASSRFISFKPDVCTVNGYDDIEEYICAGKSSYCPEGDGTPATPALGCHDSTIECPGWANNGECVSNKPYMDKYCVASCRMCQPTPAPTTRPTVPPTRSNVVKVSDTAAIENSACLDSLAGCTAWAKQGECLTHAAYMKSYCPKSCKCVTQGNTTQMVLGSLSSLSASQLDAMSHAAAADLSGPAPTDVLLSSLSHQSSGIKVQLKKITKETAVSGDVGGALNKSTHDVAAVIDAEKALEKHLIAVKHTMQAHGKAKGVDKGFAALNAYFVTARRDLDAIVKNRIPLESATLEDIAYKQVDIETGLARVEQSEASSTSFDIEQHLAAVQARMEKNGKSAMQSKALEAAHQQISDTGKAIKAIQNPEKHMALLQALEKNQTDMEKSVSKVDQQLVLARQAETDKRIDHVKKLLEEHGKTSVIERSFADMKNKSHLTKQAASMDHPERHTDVLAKLSTGMDISASRLADLERSAVLLKQNETEKRAKEVKKYVEEHGKNTLESKVFDKMNSSISGDHQRLASMADAEAGTRDLAKVEQHQKATEKELANVERTQAVANAASLDDHVAKLQKKLEKNGKTPTEQTLVKSLHYTIHLTAAQIAVYAHPEKHPEAVKKVIHQTKAADKEIR